ncbi:Adenylosuccinate synthetase [compost metagenome]
MQWHAKPIYESHPGWCADTSGARKLSELPANARRYLKRLSQLLETPITLLSVGSHEKQTLQFELKNGKGCF